MKRQSLTGWYCDAQPDGTYAVLIPDSHITTSHGDVPLPGRNVLFLVCGRVDGVLCLAGQGGDDGQCWIWNGSEWRAVCPTYGTSPCAFHPAGVLYVSMPTDIGNIAIFNPRTFEQTSALTQPVGARGIAAVDQFGVHSVDGWYGGDLAEFVDLQGIQVGQDFTDGCAISGRLLEPGVVYFIRAHRDGDQISVAMWKPKEALAVCFWFTVAEIASLPLVSAPPVVPPVPPVVPPLPPEPPKMPDPQMPSAAFAIVKRMFNEKRMDYPATEDGARAWTQATAEQLKFSLPADEWGAKARDVNAPKSKDVVARPRKDGSGLIEGWELLTSAGALGPRQLTDPPAYQSLEGQALILVPAINHLGDVTVPPIQPPPSDGTLSARLAALELRVTHLEQRKLRLAVVEEA